MSDVDAEGLSILGRLGGSCCILGSVVEQSNMGAYFVSQCYVVICVGLLLVIALRILVVTFLVYVQSEVVVFMSVAHIVLTMRLNLVE